MRRIGLDAMGGDFAPEAAVQGALMALEAVSEGTKIVLFGDRERIVSLAGDKAARFEVVHAAQVLEMGDHPVQAFAEKTDSSVVVGFHYLAEGKINAFASAGNTGAMMVGSMQAIGQLAGIIRPAISAVMSTTAGGHVVLLDVGLNSDCKAEVLAQYGILGDVYARSVLGLENPRVALLNIGEEKGKGNLAVKAAYELMEVEKINFVGNVEAKHLLTGEVADVVVCDGFVGNCLLKMAEGFYELAKSEGIDNQCINALNYEMAGGTAVLGVGANVMVGHGVSSPLAFKNMILQSERNVMGGLIGKLEEIFSR